MNIIPSEWQHRETLEWNGNTFVSSYNHNYYQNIHTGEIILEEYDDCDFFDYWLVQESINNMLEYKNIGGIYDYEGIFDNSSDEPVELIEE